MSQDYWVYILLCENNTYYTGYTHHLMRRYHAHVTGASRCKYTRSFKPVSIAQSWHIDGSKALAMQLERQIKRLSRAEKEQLILNPSLLSADPRVKCHRVNV